MNALLGSRIRGLRAAKGYTQEYVADCLGVSRQKYARIENGTNSITLDFLSKAAKMFGVTIGDITRILDGEPEATHSVGTDGSSSKKVFDMLDLFYANKHLYKKLRSNGRA